MFASWIDSIIPPTVLDITISSTVPNTYGTNPPYSFATVVGNEEQLRTVPVGGANRIAIQFSEDVDIAQGDLDLIALNRVNLIPSISSFDPPTNANDFIATWTYTASLPGAQYLLRLSDTLEDLTGTSLDGEWTNPGTILSSLSTSEFPSGDGLAGGDFEFIFTYLPGDANRTLHVTITDLNILSANFGKPTGNFTWEDADFSGNGEVSITDNNLLAPFFGKDWRNLKVLGDYDDNFVLDDDDEDAFLDLYGADDLAADLNGDNDVTIADYDAFYALLGFGIDLHVVV